MSEELETPQEYYELSKQVPKLWQDFIVSGEGLDRIIDKMRNILLEAGFSKTKAMIKIAEDHQHLTGFSLPNLYRIINPKPIETKFSQNEKTTISNNVIEEKHIPYTPNSETERFRQEKGTIVQKQEQIQQPQPQQEQQEETSTIEEFFIPPNRFRKVFQGMMIVRMIGEETGVYITKDWQVKTTIE